jgi:hypothetical protein
VDIGRDERVLLGKKLRGGDALSFASSYVFGLPSVVDIGAGVVVRALTAMKRYPECSLQVRQVSERAGFQVSALVVGGFRSGWR